MRRAGRSARPLAGPASPGRLVGTDRPAHAGDRLHTALVRRGKESMVGSESSTGLSHRPLRRRASQRPEGRWSVLPWGRPETEAHAVFQAGLLLQRTGIVARELALMDPWLLPWRILYEVL